MLPSPHLRCFASLGVASSAAGVPGGVGVVGCVASLGSVWLWPHLWDADGPCVMACFRQCSVPHTPLLRCLLHPKQIWVEN